ncbi:MAG: DEAD/DEAH box helicase [Thermoanaerobaculia bacterium]|nr:DEAD/DEAH box helicase [Thermoanaerobaculia bacterium]
MAGLRRFHPVVARWFEGHVGSPTETQRRAWARIAEGEHVLVTAPTGSGKTLTAFLWALDRLLTGEWEGGRTRVLYVSPLKALNNDIERNLLFPLAGLETAFERAGIEAHPVRVRTRSGDTPTGERQKMVRRPPEILITTPESLNILLTSKGGRGMLGALATVILDEIHAVAGSKRGTHLITAVERLTELSGEVQRIALSATVRPLARVARFVGGYRRADEGGGEPVYRPRPVEIVRTTAEKRYDFAVAFPEEAAAPQSGGGDDLDLLELDRPPDGIWTQMARALKQRIRANRSTLLFGNSRRMVEKLTRHLNEDEVGELAYSHHGSLSREIRTVVERRLKEGRLAAIVATNSLELGIDVGSLDEVLMVGTPPSVASAVQRVGRSGHRVGETARGRLYPIFGRDFLDAAVVGRAVAEGDVEEVRPVTGALDVLAQVLLSMLAAEPREIDELYDFIRTAAPYRRLSRRQFDLVLEMLAGRYADSRVRELAPRVSIDRLRGVVRARPGAARLIYLSGGTIPDRGYFNLRLADSKAKLGELDEEFVWERSVGDSFTLGAQSWRIVRVTHNDVLVTPAPRAAAMAPFWRAEARDRSFHLSERVGLFLERAEETLRGSGGTEVLLESLQRDHHMEPFAAGQLVELLLRQRAATGRLPHRRLLLVERFRDDSTPEKGREGREQLVLHTFWGGRVNRPLTVALAAAWERRHGTPLEIDHDNDCVILALPAGVEVDEILELVRSDNLESLLRRGLARTGFFGARFRENAGRALLLPRGGFRRRVPLWLSRERAKKLLDTVSRYRDFPVLVETWRHCLQDAFELETARRLLGELERGEIEVLQAATGAPSPFAAGLIWQRTNRLMYEDDVPEGETGGLSGGLLKELVHSSRLRPRLPADLLDRFQRKLHRTYPGYAPRTADELVDWVVERIAIPRGEWRQLLAAIDRDGAAEGGGGTATAMLAGAGDRLARLGLAGADRESGEWEGVVVATEAAPRLLRALGREADEVVFAAVHEGVGEGELRRTVVAAAELPGPPAVEGGEGDPLEGLVAEWVRYYGPFDPALLGSVFGLPGPRVDEIVESLAAAETVVVDQFRGAPPGEEDEAPLEVCDAENLERLLRILRASSRVSLPTLPLARLPLFLASHQGLAGRGGGVEDLERALERLFLFPAPAPAWEADLLPARLDPYYPSWLDSLMQESRLLWVGCGREKVTFAFPGDLELLEVEGGQEGDGEEEAAGEAVSTLFADPGARYSLEELARQSGVETSELTRRLWDLAWRGRVSNSTFLAVRQGALARFRAGEETPPPRAPRPPGGRRFRSWRSERPHPGDWFLLNGDRRRERPDALDLEELNKERARVLLERYGVLFRELALRELPGLGWGRIFRSLRLMELSGEIFSGHFFDGIPGLQFATPAALRRLRDGLAEDAVYWMSAIDPAAPCGLGLEGFRGESPARLPSNHLVFHGQRLVLVSRRGGGELEIRVAADHPHLEEYLEFLKVQLTRQFDPVRAVDVETINGEPAVRSPFAAPLAGIFALTREPGALRLRRRY